MSSENPKRNLCEAFVKETGCNVFLTGKAGTGKTTLLQELKKSCDKRLIVTAPTGVAAINANGVTLHSFFQMPFGPILPEAQNRNLHKFNKEKINIIKGLDLLIIDEISMVRADLLDGIDTVLRRYRRSSKPFGGVQLLLIGDLLQLPPVIKQHEWQLLQPYYSSPYFFSSRALSKEELICIELDHIYRQQDEAFIHILNQVRNNSVDPKSLDALNSRFVDWEREDKQDLEGYITLCSHNARADSINNIKLEQLSAPTKIFSAEIEGEFPEHSFPTAHDLELKVGAQVMFIRNDPSQDKLYFNGKIGDITAIENNSISILCPDDKDEIIIEPVTWENIEYNLDTEQLEIKENKIGAFTQYPLKLAWAITIHKSQGLTFDKAIIDAQAAFAHGQVYVALSRCRTFEGLVLRSPLSQTAIKIDNAVLEFTKHAQDNCPSQEKLYEKTIQYQQKLLRECFDFGRLHFFLNKLVSQVESSDGLVRILGIQDLSELQEKASKQIFQIGSNFINQLNSLFRLDLQVSDDPVITERLTKASVYFTEQMQSSLLTSVTDWYLETDNKEIRKQVKSTLSKVQEETAIKLAAVQSCEKGFSTALYLKNITNAQITIAPKKRKDPIVVYSQNDIEHPELFDTLQKWRKKKAKGENLAHFQILHQKTMVQIAVHLPETLSALKKIRGIGDKLTEKYGQELTRLVQDYRKKHGIDQVDLPQSSEQSTDHSTSETKATVDTKAESFELFKQGLSLDEVARQRALTKQTIERHLAYFISLGEIDLEKLVDKEKSEEILEALRTNQTSKLSEIKQGLGEDISYSEIKFVRAHLEFLNNG